MEIEINYIAVLGGAIAYMILGGIWYGPLFGKLWMKFSGFTKETMNSVPGMLSPAKAMAFGFIAALLKVFVLAHFVAMLGLSGFADGLELAFWIWLGFIATTMANAVFFEAKSKRAYVLNVAYEFLGLAIAGIILTL